MVFLLLLSTSRVEAVTYHVNAATGDNSRTPAQAQNPATPWDTIQKAADNVNPGDTVSVVGGIYQERVVFNRSGTAGSIITFLCTVKDACVVDGGTQVIGGWTQVSTGVFERANSEFGFGSEVPAHATIGHKMIVFVRPEHTPNVNYLAQPPGSPEWPGVEGACQNFGSVTRCRFQDNASPDTKDLRLAPENVGAFHISGSTKSYLTFDGFYIRNAYSAFIIGEGAHHITVQNCTLTHGYYNTWVRFGAHNNLFQNNRWFLNWIHADHGHHRYTTVSQANQIQDNIFEAMRNSMPISTSFYLIDPGSNNRVINNHFDHTGAAGVYLWSTQFEQDPSYTYANTEIANNTFNNCQDYCFQIQDTKAINFQYHHNSHNTYYNCTRIGRVLNDTNEHFYYYRNTCTNPDGCLGCLRGGDLEFSAVSNVGQGIFPNGGKAYFYHNTRNGRDGGILAYGNQNLQNMFFVNEVFSPGKNWQLDLVGNPAYGSRMWVGGAQGGGNNGGSALAPPGWMAAPVTWAVPIRIWADSETVFALPSGNPAINTGVNLSATWNAGGAGNQPALPGMTPGYFVGSAPDYGAVEFGEVVIPLEAPSKLSGQITMRGRVTVR